MSVICTDLPERWRAGIEAALAAASPAITATDVLLLGGADAGAARAHIAAFAAKAPAAATEGQDRLARAQVIWILPEDAESTLAGALRQAARDHAPDLRINGIVLGPVHPQPEPWQAAWAPAQAPCPARPAPEALAQALTYLLGLPSVTGQILHTHSPLR
ncbi:hypothetical protein [Rhodobacter lacus]|uniref:Uncharacterized protein n=1 Tax=Rhodobacter lacus TaxID=1641972 RepID=A0ABW5A567_9RHOB